LIQINLKAPFLIFAKASDLTVYATGIDFYSDGVVVTFSDTSTADYSWVKDELGRIISLSNITPEPDEMTSITTIRE
jgi:hypothetical protein